MAWTLDTLDNFKRITTYDVEKLLNDFFVFNEEKKQKIFDYYEGNSEIDGEAFKTLSTLQEEFKLAITKAKLNNESFQTYDFWELFQTLEDTERKLSTIYNSGKFLRSAIATGNFNANPLVEITLTNEQTLEKLARSLGSEDPQNDWAEIFLNNQLTEEDYTTDGGTLLKVTFQGGDPLFIASVVDTIDEPDKTYGKDIQARLDFENNDLKTLTYKETLLQSINILSTLKKGSNPEFINQGIDGSLLGSTFGSLSFPSIFRQIYQSFSTDDSLKSFSIINLDRDGSSIRISYNVETKSGDIQEGSLSI